MNTAFFAPKECPQLARVWVGEVEPESEWQAISSVHLPRFAATVFVCAFTLKVSDTLLTSFFFFRLISIQIGVATADFSPSACRFSKVSRHMPFLTQPLLVASYDTQRGTVDEF